MRSLPQDVGCPPAHDLDSRILPPTPPPLEAGGLAEATSSALPTRHHIMASHRQAASCVLSRPDYVYSSSCIIARISKSPGPTNRVPRSSLNPFALTSTSQPYTQTHNNHIFHNILAHNCFLTDRTSGSYTKYPHDIQPHHHHHTRCPHQYPVRVNSSALTSVGRSS